MFIGANIHIRVFFWGADGVVPAPTPPRTFSGRRKKTMVLLQKLIWRWPAPTPPPPKKNPGGGGSILASDKKLSTKHYSFSACLLLGYGCEGNCGGYSYSDDCYCDDACTTYGDCCDNYQAVCVDGGNFSHPKKRSTQNWV